MTRSTTPIPTEHVDELYVDLDLRSSVEVVQALAADQHRAVRAVEEAAPLIATAANDVARRLERGGRLFYAGAGTSGRLAQLDAYELFPAFAFPLERTVALLAGEALSAQAEREAAEDDEHTGRRDLLAYQVTERDVLIAVAASGSTPYTLGATRAARDCRALTVAFANNAHCPLLRAAEHPVFLNTGAEVIAGNTRLKAGTAQKIALNALSTTVMVRLGKVYQNLMIDVQASNAKLRARAVRLVITATRESEADARAALESSDWQVKTAIFMLQRHVDAPTAQQHIARHGSLRAALDAHKRQ